MENTTQKLCAAIELLAKATNRAPSTVSRLATGSGHTFNRLQVFDDRGKPKHRISTDRAERAMRWLSDHWPADMVWPADIPRPPSDGRIN